MSKLACEELGETMGLQQNENLEWTNFCDPNPSSLVTSLMGETVERACSLKEDTKITKRTKVPFCWKTREAVHGRLLYRLEGRH